jgi:hypothetical protein
MVRIRRIGLAIYLVTFGALFVAAFVTEGIGLAVIVATGALVVAALLVPLLSMFEEERDLPAGRAERRWH